MRVWRKELHKWPYGVETQTWGISSIDVWAKTMKPFVHVMDEYGRG